MSAKIFFITLAVDDLGRPLACYRDGLGRPAPGAAGQEFHDELTGAAGTIAIVTLDDGLPLMPYERANLAKDASLPSGPPSYTEFSLGIPPRAPLRGRLGLQPVLPHTRPGPSRHSTG